MSITKTKAHHSEKTASTVNKSHTQTPQQSTYSLGPEQTPLISPDLAFTSASGIQMLQRTMGNRAVSRFIQAKLTIGKSGDKYEQEADRVTTQVMKMPAPVLSRAPDSEKDETIQAKPITEQITPFVQRQHDDEEKVQKAPIALRQPEKEDEQVQRVSIIERQEEEETVQTATVVPEKEEKLQATSDLQYQQTDEEKVQEMPVIRQQSEDEELVQAFPVIERQEKDEEIVQKASSVDPEKEEKVQTSPIIQNQEDEKETVQKAPAVQFKTEKEEKVSKLSIVQPQGIEEEQIQTDLMVQSATDDKKELQRTVAPLTSINVQRRESADSSGVSQYQEQMIQSSKGSGSPLSPNTRQFYESRFNADFSGVRIHNDSRAANLSQNLNAQAFTVGNDIYFNKGKYDTGTSAGKGLLAHELTHTVQQGASGGIAQSSESIQCKEAGSTPSGNSKDSKSTSGPSSATVSSSGSGGKTTPADSPGASVSSGNTAGKTSSSIAVIIEDTSSAAKTGDNKGKSVSGESNAVAVDSISGDKATSGASERGGAAGASAGGAGAGPSGNSSGSGNLILPEYRSELTPEEQKRVSDVGTRSSTAASQTEELPGAAATVSEAQGAVEQPQAETASRAQGDIIATLDHREPPSPEIEKLCQKIMSIIISKRPPDEDSLVNANPRKAAQDAGNQLDSAIQGDTKRVQGQYDSVNQTPEGQPSQTSEEPEQQPQSVETTDVNAAAATPGAPKKDDVSLDKDVEANRKKMKDAGMESEPAILVQDGPIAEAREAQGELEQVAAKDPGEVLTEAMQARAGAAQNMAELQKQAMQTLASSRSNTVTNRAKEQKRTTETEEQIRQRIGTEAQGIVNSTRDQVNKLLEPLPRNAMARWDSGKEVLSTKFEQTLESVKKIVEERHSGVKGFFVSVGDFFTGLPADIKNTYTRAEREFGEGVCTLIREITSEVNGVIAATQALIANSRERIQKLFSADLPAGLKSWAAEQKAQFEGQLDDLHKQTVKTKENLNSKIAEQAAQSVQDARTKIHELRQAAGGIAGRIESAVNSFLQDPVKFIINGLLSLAGIAPAAFWALVARIQSVIRDIADDPMKFANNLVAALGKGFSKFFDNFKKHIFAGFFEWLFSGLGSVGVQIPKDFSLKSIIVFCLQLMGITWPNIRKMLVKHIGEQNMALVEKAIELLQLLMEKGPEGIFEMIKEKLDPQAILNQILETAISFLIETLITKISARIILMFNPAGAIVQAIELIYRIISWIFKNAAKIFSLVETVVNGAAQLIAGNISGMAGAVEKALAKLISPVIDFLAGFLGLGGLPKKIADTIGGFQKMVLGIIEKVIDFLAKKAKGLLGKIKAGIGAISEWWKARASFEAGDGKKHTLFFKGTGKNTKLFMRSNEISIENRITAIDDIKKREELNNLYQSTVVQPIQMNAEKDMPEQERNKFQEKIANALKMIAQKLGDLDQMPPTAVTYNLSGGRPGLVIAEPLTKKAGNTQRQASGSRSIIKGENLVDKWINKTGNKHPQSEALGVHILADHLHGPWTEWNIVFGSKSLNENMKQPEKQANDHRDQELKYNAKVNYFSDTNNDAILENSDEPSIEDLKNALSYYIAESISVKVSNKEGTTYYSDTLSGNMPNITGEPIKSINDLIIQLFKQKTTGEEIQSDGITYVKTTYTNIKNIASDISRDNERVRKTLRILIGQKVIANLAGYYYMKKDL